MSTTPDIDVVCYYYFSTFTYMNILYTGIYYDTYTYTIRMGHNISVQALVSWWLYLYVIMYTYRHVCSGNIAYISV